MFYDNLLKLYRNKLPIKKIISNNVFVLKKLWEVHRIFFLFLVFKTIFFSFNTIIYSYILKNIIGVIEKNGSFHQVAVFAALMMVLFAAERIITYINTRLKDVVSVKFTVYMNQYIYEKISNCELDDYEDANWNNDLNNALSVNKDAFSIVSVFAEFVSTVISTITVVAILFAYKWYLCILVIFAALFTAVISSANKKLQYNYQMSSAEERRKASYYPGVLFNGDYAKERKMFDYSEWLIKKYKQANLSLAKKLQLLCNKLGRNFLLTNVLSNVLSVVTVLIIASDALNGKISIASFSLYVSLFSAFVSDIYGFLNSCVSLHEKALYLNYLIEFLAKIAVKKIFAGSEPVEIEKNNIIEFQNVYFKYPSEKDYTIKNANFSFRSDEVICLVGVNGAGKTTLIKLLLGLYAPTDGRVLFNGKDLQSLNIVEYRKLFACCFQDFCRYSFTVSENLIFDDLFPQKTEDITNALMKVGLFDKINSFEDYINTPLTRYYDESGRELSGGEWQKLSLARAILHNNTFLILDEPSSNLDAIAENEIFNVIENNVKTGVLFVSHRLSSAQISDKIIVMDAGEIKECGSHEELIKKGGLYNRLFKIQAERYSHEV